MERQSAKALSGTFAPNKEEPIHRWYPYLEGYSSRLIDGLIHEIGIGRVRTIYDPFCGSGTTPLVASGYGIASYYSETNPFMRRVTEAKTNRVRRLRNSGIGGAALRRFADELAERPEDFLVGDAQWDGFEKFFEPDVLRRLKGVLAGIRRIPEEDSGEIALVLLASVAVRASRMIRRGDLRFARENEKSDADRDILGNFLAKLRLAADDIEDMERPVLAETVCLSGDAKDMDAEDMADCVITSPPWLNGTGYVKNTKLELKLSGCIRSEQELPALYSTGITAGLNNVSKRKRIPEPRPYVRPYAEALSAVAYDRRIPAMVCGYFHDMEQVIERLSRAVRDGGTFIMDIGDSQFAGVHIPTHELLIRICENYGFQLYAEEILRKRRSRNNMTLSQRLLKFQLRKSESRF